MWRMSWIVSHVNSMVASDRSKPPGNGAMPLSGGWVLMQSRSAPGKRFYYNSRFLLECIPRLRERPARSLRPSDGRTA